MLRARYRELKRRLQRSDGSHELERLDSSIDRRTRQVERIDEQISRLRSQRDRLEREIHGCLTGSEALLTELVNRFEAIDGHDWTPIPITGYTAWTEHDGALHDGSITWHSPSAVGRCHGSKGGDLPHATPACAERGCGIVGLRRLQDLDDPGGNTLTALGRLEMSGMIVEHEHGFRAQLAEVVGVVVFDGTRWFRSRDRGQLEQFFEDPQNAFSRLCAPISPIVIPLMEADEYLGEPTSPRRTAELDAPPALLGEILRSIVVEPIRPAPDDGT